MGFELDWGGVAIFSLPRARTGNSRLPVAMIADGQDGNDRDLHNQSQP